VQLFWMDRLAGGSDKRLHGRASFGVGGHISPNDGGIRAALAREWAEPLTVRHDLSKVRALQQEQVPRVWAAHPASTAGRRRARGRRRAACAAWGQDLCVRCAGREVTCVT
jgi:hypothetical protein